jgi:hypothetical protein
MAAVRRRPGVVTFIGVVLYIYAAMAAVAALVLLIFSGNDKIQENSAQSLGLLIGSGIGEAVIAALLFVVAASVMRGAPAARLFVAVVVGLRMAAAVGLMLVHHSGGYLFSGLGYVIVGVFVLWALYAAPGSDEYFSQLEAGEGAVSPPPPTAT